MMRIGTYGIFKDKMHGKGYITDMTKEQEAAVRDLKEQLEKKELEADMDRLDELLWETLIQFQGHSFYTAKELEFLYVIKGNEMFVTRKDKSITQASILMSFHKALELGRVVAGPKKLGTFGASYLYPVFRYLGVIRQAV